MAMCARVCTCGLQSWRRDALELKCIGRIGGGNATHVLQHPCIAIEFWMDLDLDLLYGPNPTDYPRTSANVGA